MLQKDLLLPYRTIQDNVALPLLLRGMKKKEPGPRPPPCSPSLVWRGRKAVARPALRRHAPAGRPAENLPVLPECGPAGRALLRPGHPDQKRGAPVYLEVMDQIRLSTLFITHDIDEAILLSDRIYLLMDGRTEHEVVIQEPRPRHLDFNLTPEFLDYKKRILSLLHTQA